MACNSKTLPIHWNTLVWDSTTAVFVPLSGNQLVRFGFQVASGAASTIATARVAGRVEVRDF